MKIARVLSALGLAVLVILAASPSEGQAPKSGGWLTLRLREDLPQGFAINESPTISTMWPAMPCLSNLVLFDPLKPLHSVDTIVGELAERWSWQDSYRKLVFFLRNDVKWHDGKPFSAFVVGDLKRVGIDASLRQVDSAQWYPLQARGEFEVGADRTGVEPDDPDANFYEHFGCRSSRNYSGYCDEQIARLIDQQSQELDAKKRLALVQEIQTKLEDAAVRPVLAWRLDYFAAWPHVKNLVPHHSIYSWGRMQDVWRER